MHLYKSNELQKRLLSKLFFAALLCILITSTLLKPSHAEGFRILAAETKLKDHVIQLDANMDLKFSDDALEALRSGVPLIVLINIEVLKDRNWWWDKTIAELEQGYLLLYHALSEKYIIHNLNSGAQQNYISLNTALYSLSNVRSFPLIDKNLLERVIIITSAYALILILNLYLPRCVPLHTSLHNGNSKVTGFHGH